MNELSALKDVHKIDYVVLNAGILEYPNVRQTRFYQWTSLILAEGNSNVCTGGHHLEAMAQTTTGPLLASRNTYAPIQLDPLLWPRSCCRPTYHLEP